MDIENVKKIRVLVSLKTDGGYYPPGTILYAPFPEDLLVDIELGNTVEVMRDSPVVSSGEPAGKPSPVPPDIDERQQLEGYIGLLDPNITVDKRKGVKSLRKDVVKLVMQKAKELGETLDSKADIQVLMKEFLDLKVAVQTLEDEDI